MAANSCRFAFLGASLAALATPTVHGASVADPSEIAACRAIADAVERAGCYDLLFGAPDVAPAPAGDQPPAAPTPVAGEARPFDTRPGAAGPVEASAAEGRGAGGLARDAADEPPAGADLSAMAIRWELDRGTNRGLWLPRGHRRTYILPASWSSERNQQPGSPTQPAGPVPLGLKDVEAKFQLSLKLKAADDLFGSKADLWVGYTQQSNWQVYNADLSRPFRETNYEPELFATIPARYSLLGLEGRMFNVGIVHQSNGRSNPLSRSWNRVYAQAGFERGQFSLLVRPWVRLHEKNDDDNPDITSYVGRGDVQAIWSWGERTVSLLARNSFSGAWRGYYQLGYSFPVVGNLKGYVQVSNGYGESLIDYNHNQTTIGLGVLVIDLQ
jgi:phospholipase A1